MDTAAKTELRILMLEDEPTDAELIERVLREAGLHFILTRVENGEDFIEAIVNSVPEIVLVDCKLPNFDGLTAIGLIRTMDADLPVITVTGTLSDEAAVQLIRAGANDYVLKDRLARLPSAVQRAVTEAEGRRERKRIEHALRESDANLRESLKFAVKAISTALEMRDPYTAGHQRRVAELATAIARELGMGDSQIEGLSLAAAIHDIGKISIPAEVLTKPARLTSVEYQLIQGHVESGYEIIKDAKFLWPIGDIILQHHERLNGSGYPNGLKGDAILLEARIVAVADVVESMLSHRPYRPALGLDAAMAEIEAGKGILYDPAVVDVCVDLFRKKEFDFY
jgi:putative two-component system response regulator